MKDKDTNPFDLKNLDTQPKDYLDTNDFSKFLLSIFIFISLILIIKSLVSLFSEDGDTFR